MTFEAETLQAGALPPSVIARRSAIPRRWGGRPVMSVVSVLLLLALWELAALAVADPIALPTPFATLQTFAKYMSTPYPTIGYPLWQHALFSMVRILEGFVAGTVVGITVGALMIAVRPIRYLVDPIIELIRPLPPLAFIPIFIVWFGIGDAPKVILIALGVVPVMVVTTVAALDRVPQEMINAARCLGASRRYTLTHVTIRAALPHLITGLRISMGFSWGSIVAAEMIVATNGLGYLILQAGVYLQTGLIFSGIIAIGALGLGLDAILRTIQRGLDPAGRQQVEG